MDIKLSVEDFGFVGLDSIKTLALLNLSINFCPPKLSNNFLFSMLKDLNFHDGAALHPKIDLRFSDNVPNS